MYVEVCSEDSEETVSLTSSCEPWAAEVTEDGAHCRSATFLAAPLCALAQIPSPAQISSDDALNHALEINTLTFSGSPFHAVLEIRTEESKDSDIKGRIEVFWQDEQKYRLQVESPKFTQTLIVNHGRVFESDHGDFYPNWLRRFVTALLEPMPRLKDLHGSSDMVQLGPTSYSCVSRDDRRGGITDMVTWARACFSGTDAQLNFVVDLTYRMQFGQFREFGTKQIAHAYQTVIGDDLRVSGTLTTLEEWRPDESLLSLDKEAAPSDRILTTLVSTPTEESMLESAPKDVTWPPVREGKTDGYMIVDATTDRTGQVRETSKRSSDNPALESFGQTVALKYKFKPLIVNGSPQQMEMPLVLHFSTTIKDPIPELDDATTRRIVSRCSLPHAVNDPASAGQKIVITFQVQNDGGLMTLGSSDRKIPVMTLYQQFRGCHFGQYKQNGVPTAYHANLTVTAK
jgi:hypothetical protein